MLFENKVTKMEYTSFSNLNGHHLRSLQTALFHFLCIFVFLYPIISQTWAFRTRQNISSQRRGMRPRSSRSANLPII